MSQRAVKRRDPLNVDERSARMSLVRAKGNRSTEMSVAASLVRSGLRGWKRQCRSVPGCPDFFFPIARVAVFVDGCFWHGCPSCRRNVPHSRRRFWVDKIAANKRRDRRVMRLLKAEGYGAVRIWEHALADGKWLPDLQRLLDRAGNSAF